MKSPQTLTLSIRGYLFLIAASFALQAQFASAKGDDLHFYYLKDQKCYQTNNSNPEAGEQAEVNLPTCQIVINQKLFQLSPLKHYAVIQ